PRLSSDRAPPRRRRALEGLGRSTRLDRLNEEMRGKLIAPGRERHLDLTRGSPVELARAPGPGSRTTRQATVGGFEEARLDQLVQVERRQRPGKSQSACRLIAADLARFARNVLIKRPAHRVPERGDAIDVPIQFLVALQHGSTLKQKLVGEN